MDDGDDDWVRRCECAADSRRPQWMRLFTTFHIFVSAFGLAAILSDVQRQLGIDLAFARQRMLLSARLDGELIPSLDRDGNGVDRIEYLVGMLTHMNILQWSDVQPFLDQFDQMDVDGSGHLDRADLELWADKFSEGGLAASRVRTRRGEESADSAV